MRKPEFLSLHFVLKSGNAGVLCGVMSDHFIKGNVTLQIKESLVFIQLVPPFLCIPKNTSRQMLLMVENMAKNTIWRGPSLSNLKDFRAVARVMHC